MSVKVFAKQFVATALLLGLFLPPLYATTAKEARALEVSDTLSDLVGNIGSCVGAELAGSLLNKAQGWLADSGISIDSLTGGGGSSGQVVPVHDEETLDDLSAIGEAHLDETKSLVSKEFWIDCLIWAASKTVLDLSVKQGLGHIVEGNYGDPFFVENLPEYFASLEDRRTNELLEQLKSVGADGSLIQVVGLDRQVRHDIVTDFGTVTVGAEFEDSFSEGGGWEAYMEFLTKPQNNNFSGYLAINNELDRRIGISAEAQKRLLEYGSGFFPEVDNEGNVKTPGAVIEVQANRLIESGVEQLEASDELSELIGVLANLIFNLLGANSSLIDISFE